MKDPAFLFYSSDFLTGTLTMTNEQVGKYIKLLCLQHQKKYLTKKDMLFICGEEDEEIFSKFSVNKEGEYYNNRLKYEAEKRENYTKSRRNNRNQVDNSNTCIYLIKNNDNGLIKIGSSNKPERRIIELKNQLNTENLTLVACVEGTNQTIENELHKKYVSKCNMFEWYSLNDKDVSEIISLYHMTEHINNHMTPHMENENINEDVIKDVVVNEDVMLFKEVINYLNNKIQTSFKYSSNKTQDLIKARLREGFTLQDFYTVIDKKVAEWIDTDMQKFLRPETLFSNKFEGYLNQRSGKPKTTLDSLREIYNEEEAKNEQTGNE